MQVLGRPELTAAMLLHPTAPQFLPARPEGRSAKSAVSCQVLQETCFNGEFYVFYETQNSYRHREASMSLSSKSNSREKLLVI